jgi:hypothetical protein
MFWHYLSTPFVWFWYWLGSGPDHVAPATVVYAILGMSYITYVVVYSSMGRYVRSIPMNLYAAIENERIANFFAKIGEGIQCPYCGGFWLTIMFQLIYRLDILQADSSFIPKQVSVLFSMAIIGGVQAIIAFGHAYLIQWSPCDSCAMKLTNRMAAKEADERAAQEEEREEHDEEKVA